MARYSDPSKGKTSEPVTFVGFKAPFVANLLRRYDGKIRTYAPGAVDDRILPLKPMWCDDGRTLFRAMAAGTGEYIAPVSLAREVLGYKTKRMFAEV
jgi:hypothetical protein